MISLRFRTLGFVFLGALAAAVAVSAVQANRLSALLAVARPAPAEMVPGSGPAKRSLLKGAPALPTAGDAKIKQSIFTLYTNESGEVVCRDATDAEKLEMANPDLRSVGLKAINHLETAGKSGQIQPAVAPNLTIVLRATQQLQQNQAATDA